MFKALDKVNYARLDLCSHLQQPKKKLGVPSLLKLCCQKINSCHVDLIREALSCIPNHLAPVLLEIAIDRVAPVAIITLISNWPLPVLCFGDVVHPENKDIFTEEMGLDLMVFKGVIERTKSCKIKVLDLRGFKLNATFSKLIVQMWPILSLKKHQLKPKKLAKIIAKAADVEFSRYMEELLPRMLNDILSHEMVQDTQILIRIPRGEKMIVKIDNIHFTASNTFFMDYLICNCLRSVTPVAITVSNIHIKSDLAIGEEVMDSLAPFIVLKGQDINTLEGLSLRQLEEGIFFMVSPNLKKFSRLRSLDLQDCNIYLQEGKTRSRTIGRAIMVRTLSCFENLVRLDLSFNYLLGCLGEILDALKLPLEFLSLRNCDLNEDDLECLANSKHALSLQELNLSKICQFSIYDNDRISSNNLFKVVFCFKNVKLLNLAQNHFQDSSIPSFCEKLPQNLKKLQYLDIAGNVLTEDSTLQICKALAKVKTFQWFRLTCSNNLLDEALGHLNQAHENAVQAKLRICGLLSALGRTDIHIEIVKLSYAIFVDLMDVMEL